MGRKTGPLLIAIALAAFGLYRAVYAIAMLPGPASLLLFLLFALQAVFAILGAVCVWRLRSEAGMAALLLGASIAATPLVEAFVLGIMAWLHALLFAIAAIVGALFLRAYLGTLKRSDSASMSR